MSGRETLLTSHILKHRSALARSLFFFFSSCLTARLRDFADPTGQRDSAHKGPSVAARRVKYSQLTGRTLYNMIYLCAREKSFQTATALTFYRSPFQNNFAADRPIQRTVSQGHVTPAACDSTRPPRGPSSCYLSRLRVQPRHRRLFREKASPPPNRLLKTQRHGRGENLVDTAITRRTCALMMMPPVRDCPPPHD